MVLVYYMVRHILSHHYRLYRLLAECFTFFTRIRMNAINTSYSKNSQNTVLVLGSHSGKECKRSKLVNALFFILFHLKLELITLARTKCDIHTQVLLVLCSNAYLICSYVEKRQGIEWEISEERVSGGREEEREKEMKQRMEWNEMKWSRSKSQGLWMNSLSFLEQW